MRVVCVCVCVCVCVSATVAESLDINLLYADMSSATAPPHRRQVARHCTDLSPRHTSRVLVLNYLAYPGNRAGLLGSRVVSVLNSGAEGPGFKSQSRRCQTRPNCSHPPCLCSPKAAKLVAAVLRVARVTAGLAESNGSLPQRDRAMPRVLGHAANELRESTLK